MTFSPEIIAMSANEYLDILRQAGKGEVREKYAFLLMKSLMRKTAPEHLVTMHKVKKEVVKKPQGILILQNNMMFEHLNYFLDLLIPSGIPQHLLDFGLFTTYNHVHYAVVDSRKVLSLEILEFGFVLWLAACFISLIVFLCEARMLWLRRKLRKLIGLIDFLRILRARLSDYHDKW